MSQLLDTLARWRPFSALVVGDYMLDRLTFGDVDRLCADAPVPVLAVDHTDERPGGAANVCLDLAVMHARVHAVGLCGDDEHGRTLRRLLAEAGVQPSGVVSDGARPTTVKQSLIGLAQHRHAQKLFRLDFEKRDPAGPHEARAMLDAVSRLLGDVANPIDVVCIEDYGKGACTPDVCQGVIALARARRVPVLVDPAPTTDYARYRGASTITPNRNEAQLAARGLGLALSTAPDAPEDFAPIARRLVHDLDLDSAVITLDKHGALLCERTPAAGEGSDVRTVPTVARQVYDVTGAGDMVLAALAAARAHGLDWFDSVRFANAAAGLEVEQFGVVPIPIEQIHRDILTRERATRGKTRTLAELQVEIAAIRGRSVNGAPVKAGGAVRSAPARKPTVVFANGCFDVLHAGHVSLLRRAAALGDFLIVAINDDAGVRKLKGPGRPVYPVEDRAALLGELECVGAVVVFSDDTPESLVRAIRPDVLVKGAQYDPATIPGAAFVKSFGGRVELLDVVKGRSTTGTVSRIRGA